MSIERVEPGPRMSRAVVHGNTIYLSGQVADKAKGASVAEQTTEILAIIEGLLAGVGSEKSKILSVNIWLRDIASFAEMNSVWDTWVDTSNPPARATVEAKLAAADYAVEIAAIAAK